MIALLNYMEELCPLDTCAIHGKEYMFRHRIEGKGIKHLLEQEWVYYCIMCCYEDDKEYREIQGILQDHMCKGAR